MTDVIIDTNVFILATQQLSLFPELQRVIGPCTPATTESVLTELERLCDDGNDDACTATALIQSKGLKIVSGSSSYADSDIVAHTAQHPNTPVVTDDAELIQHLKNNNITVYRPRQRNHLIPT